MSYTQVDTLQKNKKSTIAIRPYVDQNIENILKKTKYVCISIPIWEKEENIKKWVHYKS